MTEDNETAFEEGLQLEGGSGEGASEPRRIELSPGKRIRVRLGQYGSDSIGSSIIRKNKTLSGHRGLAYSLLLDWDDGETEWQEHVYKNLPYQLAKQSVFCRKHRFKIRQLAWADGSPTCWFISGEKTDLKKRSSKRTEVFQKIGSACPDFLRASAEALDAQKISIVEFGRWGGVYGGPSGVLISNRNGYQFHSVPRGLQERIKAVNKRAGSIRSICLNAHEEYWVSDDSGYQWNFVDKELQNELKRGGGALQVCVASGSSCWLVIREHDYSSKGLPVELVEKLDEFYALQRKYCRDRGREIALHRLEKRRAVEKAELAAAEDLARERQANLRLRAARLAKERELRDKKILESKAAKRYLDNCRMIAYNTGYKETYFSAEDNVVSFQKIHLPSETESSWHSGSPPRHVRINVYPRTRTVSLYIMHHAVQSRLRSVASWCTFFRCTSLDELRKIFRFHHSYALLVTPVALHRSVLVTGSPRSPAMLSPSTSPTLKSPRPAASGELDALEVYLKRLASLGSTTDRDAAEWFIHYVRYYLERQRGQGSTHDYDAATIFCSIENRKISYNITVFRGEGNGHLAYPEEEGEGVGPADPIAALSVDYPKLKDADAILGIDVTLNGIGQFMAMRSCLASLPVLVTVIRNGEKIRQVVVADKSGSLCDTTDKPHLGPVTVLQAAEQKQERTKASLVDGDVITKVLVPIRSLGDLSTIIESLAPNTVIGIAHLWKD